MHCQAVIFDMDGVLIDSEIFWDEAGKEFFSKRGVTFTRELKMQLTGQSMRRNMERVKAQFNFPETVDELCLDYWTLSNHIYEQVAQPLPGVEQLLKALRAARANVAIASGSYLSRIEDIVKRFGWQDYFAALASTDHVDFAGKPDPAVYLHAAKMLGVDPKECIAIEDSVNGLASAKAAGMRCIAALNERWSFGDFSQADVMVKSLEEQAVYDYLGIARV
jgi:HAD superfamily hydrolase (TIGR01509 family)